MAREDDLRLWECDGSDRLANVVLDCVLDKQKRVAVRDERKDAFLAQYNT